MKIRITVKKNYRLVKVCALICYYNLNVLFGIQMLLEGIIFCGHQYLEVCEMQ